MIVLRFFSLILIVLALMLLGADIISTLEMNGAIVIRSLDRVLLLVGLDPKPWLQTNAPPQLANACIALLGWAGWLTLGVLGLVLGLFTPSPRKTVHIPPPQPPIER